MPPTILPPPLARGVERAFLEKVRAGEVMVRSDALAEGVGFHILAFAHQEIAPGASVSQKPEHFVDLPEATARQAAMTIAALMVNTLE